MRDLVDAFEAGEIDAADFSHRLHVEVAWALRQRHDPVEAFARLSAGLRAMTARAGRPGAYHETMTRAWFELAGQVDELGDESELYDKRLLGRFYSAEQLAAGRGEWREPDLQPLRLPSPVPPAEVLRRIPAPVGIVAARGNGTVRATTVSSFTSLSREPMLVSISLRSGSRTLELVRRSSAFAVSFLAAEQEELAARFADRSREPGPAQFAGIPHHLGEFGPVLDDVAAWVGCRLHAVHECGDHELVVGEVGDAVASGRRPLVRAG